jgi:hypothetical protein
MNAAGLLGLVLTLIACALALRLAFLPLAHRLRGRGYTEEVYTDLTVALPLGLAFPLAITLIWLITS